MRNFLIILFLFALGINNIQAQKEDKVLAKTAKTICKCVGESLKGMDKEVLDALDKMLTMEAENPGSGAEFLGTLSPDMQMKFLTGMMSMSEGDTGIDACMQKSGLESQLKKIAESSQMTEDELMVKLVDKMKAAGKSCTLVYHIMQMAMKEESSEPQMD